MLWQIEKGLNYSVFHIALAVLPGAHQRKAFSAYRQLAGLLDNVKKKKKITKQSQNSLE